MSIWPRNCSSWNWRFRASTRRAAGTRILPLIVESADPLAQSLPWECLYHPQQGFLGQQPGFTLSRRLTVDASPPVTGLSLVDMDWDVELRLNRYRLSSVVADWLAEQQDEPALEIRQRATRYQLWMFEHLQATLEQALVAHESLRRAGLDEEAARLALAVIVPHFDRRGLYHTLLKEWLPVLRESQDQTIKGAAFNRSGKISLHVGDYENAMTYLQQSLAICRAIGDRAGEETTLNNIGLVYLAQGDYATALDYLQQSLAIRRAIGDRAGLCRGLFNMGHIHRTNEEPQQALVSWVTAYRIAREIGLAEALQNLDNLAKQLGGAGLEY